MTPSAPPPTPRVAPLGHPLSAPLSVGGANAALRRIAPATVGQATTLPLPLLHAGRPALVMLEFHQPALARKELVYAPHRRTVIDLASGEVLAHEACVPRDLGVDEPPQRRSTSFGLRDVSGDDFWRARADTERLSPSIWDDFFAGRSSAESRGRADAFRRALTVSTYAPLVPYLRGAAPAFFRWLDALATS